MIDLIRKRHPAPGWVVLDELSNSTGASATGRADAVAIGIWPSHGYEMHTFEVKISREDLKRELKDPSKGDNIGKFGDFFWLVVSDVKLVETLVLPATWGVLAPKKNGANTILSVVKKAPKREAKPWSRGFVASVIRHVHDQHVTKAKYNALREDVYKEIEQRVRNAESFESRRISQAFETLQKNINEFQKASGVDIRNPWMLGDVGAAVRMLLKAREDEKYSRSFLDIAEQHEALARTAREAAAALMTKETQPNNRSKVEAQDEVPSTGENGVS